MTPAEEIRAARGEMRLSAAGLARALELGKGGDRLIRRWEAGEVIPSGPSRVAIRLLLAEHRRKLGSA